MICWYLGLGMFRFSLWENFPLFWYWTNLSATNALVKTFLKLYTLVRLLCVHPIFVKKIVFLDIVWNYCIYMFILNFVHHTTSPLNFLESTTSKNAVVRVKYNGKIKTMTARLEWNLRRQNKIYDGRICCIYTSFCSHSFFNHCYIQSKIIIEYFGLVHTLINLSFKFPVGKTLLKIGKTISFSIFLFSRGVHFMIRAWETSFALGFAW